MANMTEVCCANCRYGDFGVGDLGICRASVPLGNAPSSGRDVRGYRGWALVLPSDWCIAFHSVDPMCAACGTMTLSNVMRDCKLPKCPYQPPTMMKE